MRRTWIALLGALLLIALGVLAVRTATKRIPLKLQKLAQNSLTENAISGIEVGVDGRHVTLSTPEGVNVTEAVRNLARDKVAAINGVAGVDVARVDIGAGDAGPGTGPAAPPTDGTFELVASFADGVLSLSGSVGDRHAGSTIIKAAEERFAETKITDALKGADGVGSDALLKASIAALEALSRLDKGELKLTAGALDLKGVSGESAVETDLSAQLAKRLSGDIKINLSIQVVAPAKPDALDATDVVEAGGTADAVAARVAGAGVDLDTAEAEAKADAADAATGVTGAAGDDADATRVDQPDAAGAQRVTDAGQAVAPQGDVIGSVGAAERDDIVAVTAPDTEKAEVDAAPSAVAASADTQAAPPQEAGSGIDLAGVSPLTDMECQIALNELVHKEKRITFIRRSTLTDDGSAKVSVAAKLMQRCPETQVTIAGYMDSYGEPDELRVTTRRRAFTVKNKLIALGIDAKRLKIMGYGKNRRKYPETKTTRQLNRRIEFKIKGIRIK